MSGRPSRLITELIVFTSAQGWTAHDLANELGIDETAIIRFRSGERSPSKRVLVKIMERFGEQRFVRDLVLFHLSTECRSDGVAAVDPLGSVALPVVTVAALRAYVERFAEESVRAGRGLYIVCAEAAPLSEALRALRRAFELANVRMQVLRGDQRPNARDLRAALAAPLVLIERVDFASEAVADVLRRRSDLTRPCIVTSMLRPEDMPDPFLRRTALSTMRLIEVASDNAARPIPSASPEVHDAA